MRIVATGATSMIGAALINECIACGDTVLAIVRRDSKHLSRLPKSERLQLEYADLDSLAQVKGDEMPYDVFYHFAWAHTNRLERDDPCWQETNIRTTLDAAELALRLGCKTFIGAGSQAEYGSLDVRIDEQTPCDPQVAYGMAKMSACLLSRKFCEQHGIKHIWTRIFSVYGTNDSDGVMIDYAVKQFLKNEPAHFSAATNIWNYLFEKDAGTIFRLLGRKDVAPGIYCVASNECRELKSYILEMKEAANTASEIVFAPESRNSKGINLNVNTEKLVKAIGYAPQVPFSEGIRIVIDSYIKRNR